MDSLCYNDDKNRSTSSSTSLSLSFFGSNSCASEDSAIANSNSMNLQQQFTGFQTSDLSNIYKQMDMDMGHLFSQDSAQQSEFEQWLSSSSSSFSTGSPVFSSLRENGRFSSSTSDQCHDLRFPTFENDDLIIAGAISAIFSSASSTSAKQNPVTSHSGFKTYNSAVHPNSEPKDKSFSQKMIKDSIAFCRKINSMRNEATNQELPQTRHHHVISEKRRREKLNESFYDLRLLLPPCSKKDKASVLCKTKDWLKTLKAQIFELEQSNRRLKKHLLSAEGNEDYSGAIGTINVQTVEVFEPEIGIRQIDLKITVRLECNLQDLVLCALEYLKERRVVSLQSIDANTYLQQMVLSTWIALKFDIMASDWDEVSFKDGMIKAVDFATIFP